MPSAILRKPWPAHGAEGDPRRNFGGAQLNRRNFFGLLLGGAAIPALPVDSPVQVEVLEGPRLIVKIPNVAKDDLAKVTATFFGRGDEKAKAKFEELLGSAKQITLIITSEPRN